MCGRLSRMGISVGILWRPSENSDRDGALIITIIFHVKVFSHL